jgi:hypothetical protein
MDDDTILSFLRSKGPSLPSDIARYIRTNTIFVGAHLSAMLEKKLICISSIKIGSSPLYYLKDQKNRIEEFISHLDEKDRRTFALLKQKKVLRDREQHPLIRVSLREIKDFAVQLNVRTDNSQEIFWKLYSLSDEEASNIIRDILEPPVIKLKIEPQKQKIEKAKSEIKKEETKIKEPRKEQKIEIKKPEPVKEKLKPKLQVQETLVKGQIKEPVKEILLEKPTEKPVIKGKFYSSVIESFGRKSITIIKEEMVKADNEYDFIIKLPTPAGDLTYYCKAKNKKKINEGDLSSAVLKAQSKRLPVLFLADGQLTKQANKSLEEELKDQIKVMSL